MSNFFRYTAINFSNFFLVFLMFSLILILYKVDNSYICLLGKSVISPVHDLVFPRENTPIFGKDKLDLK